MPKRYSPEIRRTALELVNQGQTQIEVAQALGVSPKTLSRWVTTTQARMPDQQRNVGWGAKSGLVKPVR